MPIIVRHRNGIRQIKENGTVVELTQAIEDGAMQQFLRTQEGADTLARTRRLCRLLDWADCAALVVLVIALLIAAFGR